MSPREEQVKELICRGLSNKKIAYALGITQKTVKFHLTNIFAKEGVKSRLELATEKNSGSVTISEMNLFKELMR